MEKILAAFPQIPGHPIHVNSLPEGQSEPLNPREEAILGMLARGLSNREISQKLFLSNNTLRAYTVSLFNKLGVNSRSDAVTRARHSSLLPPGEEDK
jgi:DNA-binding NarL/FixJ family response regulator